MPRYLVERIFLDGLTLSASAESAMIAFDVIQRNAEDGVTWIRSYVTSNKRKTFCIYDAPTPDAIRNAAVRSRLPVDHIAEIRVLDPYLCLSGRHGIVRVPHDPRDSA